MSERRPLPPGFAVLWVTVALDLVGFGIVLPILPLWADELGASPTEIGALVASFSLAQFLLAPFVGRLSDRFGRRPVLLASLVGTAVGSLLTGLAGGVTMLFVARIIDGASGASVSVAQAAVTDVAEPEDRPRLLGLLGAAFGVGFVVGPAIGALAALGSHRLPFVLAAVIAGVNALVAVRRLPETRRPGSPSAVQARTVPRRADLRRLLVVGFAASAAFSGFEATFALLGRERVGLTETSLGGVFVVIGITLGLVQTRLVGPFAARFGAERALRAGLVLLACGLALLVPDGGWVPLVGALAVLVVGQGLLSPSLASLVADRAADAGRGASLGAQQSVGSLARVVGPLTSGFLFEHVDTAAPYAVAAVAVCVGLVAAPGADRRAPAAEGAPA